MAIEIEAPDGSVVEFPDGTPDEAIEKAMQAEYGRKTTGLGAAAAGVGQAAFGLGDEAAAGVGAAYDYFTGQGDFSKSYDKRLKGQRDYLKSAAKENPGWYYSGLIGGAIGVPFSGPGRLATAGARALASRLGARGGLGAAAATGAIEGAGYGALYGAGQSEGGLQSRAEGAVGGGLMGGAIGGVAPVAIQGITSGVRGGVNRLRDIATPQAAATRDVARGLMAADDIRPDARQLIQSGQADDPFLRLDASERTRALGRRAANLSPEARTRLDNAVNPRFEQQSQRGADFLRRQNPTISGDNAQVQTTLREQAQRVNSGAYRSAYQQGDRPLNTPLLQDITSSPLGLKALKEAIPKVQNRQALEGYRGMHSPVDITDDGRVIFNQGGKPGAPAYPNLELWDAVKKRLDDYASEAYRAGRNNEGATASQMARQLRTELDNLVPSYQATRSRAAAFFQADDAVEAGENLARGGIRADPRAMQRAKSAMSVDERQLFETSYSNAILNKIENVKDRQDLVKRFAQSPKDRAILEVGMGRQRAREFESFIYIEEVADRARQALQGNSTTARQLMEMGGAGVGSGTLFGGGDPTSPEFWKAFFMGAGGAWGARRLNATVAERWANQVADLLTRRNDPRAIQNAMRNLARNDRFVEGMRSIMTRASIGGAGVAGGSVGAQEGPLQVEVTRGDVMQNQGAR